MEPQTIQINIKCGKYEFTQNIEHKCAKHEFKQNV